MDARPSTVLEEIDVRSPRSSTVGVIWQGSDFPDAPPMPHSSSIGLGQLVSSGGTLGTDTPASSLDNLDHSAHHLATRGDSAFDLNVELYV